MDLQATGRYWEPLESDLKEAGREAANWLYQDHFGQADGDTSEHREQLTELFVSGYLWCLRLHNLHVGEHDEN